MSRSRGRGSKNIIDIQEIRREQHKSDIAIAGSKIAKQARKGVCTIRNLSATMIFFYNKRFKEKGFAIKVM